VRTLIIIAGGFVTWGLILGVTKMLASSSSALQTATWVFLAVWLAAAGYNMWVGVTQAGYSVQDEFPIFLAIFLIPVAAALFVKWKWL
jgi:hypothetical protein